MTMIRKGKKQRRFAISRNSTVRGILRNWGIAALTTVLLYNLMVYLNNGRLNVPNVINLIEMGSAFLFLLGLFWVQRKLSERMPGLLKGFKPVPKLILEILIVSLASLGVIALLNYLPLRLIFPADGFLPAQLRYAFVISTLFGLFYYFFVERERSRKELQKELLHSAQLQKERYQSQLQHLKNQVHPHFLFNSLNVLGSLIELHPQRAIAFNQQLSLMYRIFLEGSEKELVSLKEELELVEAYIYLVKTRFGETMEIKLEIPKDSLESLLPPGGLQTLVENVVKHNGATRKEPLKVRIFVEDGCLQVYNRLRPRHLEESSSGKGLENLSNRYRFLADQEPTFEKTSTHFLAKLPLLSLEEEVGNKHL